MEKKDSRNNSNGNNRYIVEVKNLKQYFPIKAGLMQRVVGYVKAVDDISFKIERGKTMGLVGESGCGKTTVGKTILRLLKPTSGKVIYDGIDVMSLDSKGMRALRPKMQMIFQDPYSSLSPRMPVSEIIGEAVREHNLVPEDEHDDYIENVMRSCGLQPYQKDRYPHEFSGGQRQRICVARSLALKPEFVVCDEPVSALDVSIQAQIINLLEDLQQEYGLTYLFISHDLSVMRFICDRIAVIHRGRLVEMADTEQLFRCPLHPYTRALLSAVPLPNPQWEKKKRPLVYDESAHDYSVDLPLWREMAPGHFVLANGREAEACLAALKAG